MDATKFLILSLNALRNTISAFMISVFFMVLAGLNFDSAPYLILILFGVGLALMFKYMEKVYFDYAQAIPSILRYLVICEVMLAALMAIAMLFTGEIGYLLFVGILLTYAFTDWISLLYVRKNILSLVSVS